MKKKKFFFFCITKYSFKLLTISLLNNFQNEYEFTLMFVVLKIRKKKNALKTREIFYDFIKILIT